MGDRTRAGLLSNFLTQPHRCPLPSATGSLAFGESFVTAQAPESSFVQHQFDAMPPYRHLAFASLAHIVLFDADATTMRATRPLIGSDHFDPDPSVGLHLLLEDAQSCSL